MNSVGGMRLSQRAHIPNLAPPFLQALAFEEMKASVLKNKTAIGNVLPFFAREPEYSKIECYGEEESKL